MELHSAPYRLTPMSQVADTSSPIFTLRRSGTSVQEFLNDTSIVPPSHICFSYRGTDLRLASTLRSGGAPLQNYLPRLCLIDTVLHSINRDRTLNLGPGKKWHKYPAAQPLRDIIPGHVVALETYIFAGESGLTLTASGFRSQT